MEKEEYQTFMAEQERRAQEKRTLEVQIRSLPPALQAVYLDQFDTNPNFVFKQPDAQTILSMAKISSRQELTKVLIESGIRPHGPEFNKAYDDYCASRNLPL